MQLRNLCLSRFISLLVFVSCFSLSAQAADPIPADLLSKVRHAATMVPGDLATKVNFAKVAESHRTYADIIEGGSDERFVSARTAFQIVFPQGSIMLDSGMDEEVHRYYGFGRDEPYWQKTNNQVQQALRQAQQIIITHEHGDHVSGVIGSEYRDELAPKTILLKSQVETLSLRPQTPLIQLKTEHISDYVVVDYEQILSVAPGVVLIKAAGHTQGHQMIYVKLANNKELLFIGDIGWSLDNITELKLRPAGTIARIKEDPQALMEQMIWIKELMDKEGLIVIPSHDDVLLKTLAADGVLGTTLDL